MNLLLTLIIIFVNALIFQGQETEKIKRKISKKEYEVYYVLSSNIAIKHGNYELYKDKKLNVSGFYKNNIKDSIWILYKYSGDKISMGSFSKGKKNGLWSFYHKNSFKNTRVAVGVYSADTRIGLWEFYNYKDQVIQTFDFKTNTLNESDSAKKKRKKYVTEGRFKGLVYVDKKPAYFDNNKSIFSALATEIRYPESARKNNIQGKVYISFIVGVDGKLSQIEIERSVHAALDNEAIRAIKGTSGKWKPAEIEGEKVSYRVVFPVNFRLG